MRNPASRKRRRRSGAYGKEVCITHKVRASACVKRKAALHTMKTLLIIIYIVLFLFFAGHCFRKGRCGMLGLGGFIFPAMWIIGAILPSRHEIFHLRRR